MRAVRAIGALLVLSVLAPASVGGVAGNADACVGTMAAPANGTTVVSVQGMRTDTSEKKPAGLVAFGPGGEVEWALSLAEHFDAVWSYDVDPLANGNLFVVATRPGTTLFVEFDPRAREVVRSDEAPFDDTHDADLLDEHRILVANMRNYDESNGTNDDRLLIYNRTSDEVEWEWLFREHGFDRDGGGNYSEDWTHVNDVDRVREGEYLASVRNFDQVILVNRSTGEVDLRLGAEGNTSVLNHQHNPQYLASESGTPTLLVADSDNDRIVEYERQDGEWERTWALEGNLSWPRDADRLPNGNTLVVDSTNHRVIEVTPDGEVVREFATPWLPYDAERVDLGDEPGGPTTAEQNATGSHALERGEPWPTGALEDCASVLSNASAEWNWSASAVTATADSPTETTEVVTATAGTADPERTTSAVETQVVTATATGEPATTADGQAGFTALAALGAAVLVALLARHRS